MATIFSKIISRDIPCHKIAENDRFIAILDVSPLVEGHTLVIPKVEIDYIFDLDDSYLAEINLFARDVAAKIKAAVPCKRIGVAVIGLEVPHAHMHLVPLNGIADINFDRQKMKPTQEELAEVAARIRG